MYQILGIEVRAGRFKAKDTGSDINYNNVVIHCMGEGFDGSSEVFRVGNPVETLKIKNDEEHLKQVFGKVPSGAEMSDYVGKYINVYYNKYGNLDKLEVVRGKS